MARPSLYTQKIVEEIVERLSSGEPLEQICRDDCMPSSRTIHGWLMGEVASIPEHVVTDIARAREIGYDAIANRLRDVARGTDGSSGDIQRDKLIVDTDLKLLSKWSKKYGEKQNVEVNHTGTVVHLTADVSATLRFLGGIVENGPASSAGDIPNLVPDRPLLAAPVRIEP